MFTIVSKCKECASVAVERAGEAGSMGKSILALGINEFWIQVLCLLFVRNKLKEVS